MCSFQLIFDSNTYLFKIGFFKRIYSFKTVTNKKHFNRKDSESIEFVKRILHLHTVRDIFKKYLFRKNVLMFVDVLKIDGECL